MRGNQGSLIPPSPGPFSPTALAAPAHIRLPHHDDDELLLADGNLLQQRHRRNRRLAAGTQFNGDILALKWPAATCPLSNLSILNFWLEI